MQFFYTKSYAKSLRAMKREGGRKAKAAIQAEALFGRIASGDPDPLKPLRKTKHGETRINKCVKYDLTDYSRLITIQDNDCVFLLFLGGHEDADKWLESNSGLVVGVDESKQIELLSVSGDSPESRIRPQPDQWNGRILERLPKESRGILFGDLKARDVEHLHDIEAGVSDEQIAYAVERIEDKAMQTLIYDVMVELNSGDVEGAERRIELHNGNIRGLDSLNEAEILEIRDGQDVRRLEIGSDEYQRWINNYLTTSHPADWFLFMHPEQERYVDRDFNGPAKLSGVSGSGKTSIAVRRAIRLAQQYPTEKIGIVTLNRSLAELISEIVDYACDDPNLRKRIISESFFALCQRHLRKLEPDSNRIYSDVTWRLEEHKDEIYREYYRCLQNNLDAEVLLPTHRFLIAQGVDAERYISEEFDWIRSALPQSERESYLDIERKGRGYPLPREHRSNILQGLKGWEEKMRMVGVIDYMGLTTALTSYQEALQPEYRSIIVDEVQDFGTTELRILRKLVEERENDMFLCGDAAQHILPKHQVFERAGIVTTGRSFRISKNYRNSREILKAAYKIFVENLSDGHFDNEELEISDPDYANRSSAEPVVLQADSLAQELAAAIELINEEKEAAQERGSSYSACLVLAGYSQFEVQRFGEQVGLPVLDGARKVVEEPLFLSDLEQTKGYEFDTVVIANCCDSSLPPLGMPEQDAFRFSSQLYVALTRAKKNLILSYSGTPSPWLTNEKVGLPFDRWGAFVDMDEVKEIGVPGFLPELLDEEADSLMAVNGRGFLYSSYARGLDVDLQQRIEELVPGQARSRGGKRVLWKDVGQLLDDMNRGISQGGAGVVFGPKSDAVVKQKLSEASLGLRPTMRRKQSNISVKTNPPTSAGEKESRKQKAATKEHPVQSHDRLEGQEEQLQIERLRLNAKTYAKLHELHIRSVTDLVATPKKALQKYLTNSEVDALLAQASSLLRVFHSDASAVPEKNPALLKRIRSLGLSVRTQRVLEKAGVRSLYELGQVTEKKLAANPACGRPELEEIRALAMKYDIDISGT